MGGERYGRKKSDYVNWWKRRTQYGGGSGSFTGVASVTGTYHYIPFRVVRWSASATTLVSIRNTRVFRTALTALTEPRTLWRRITRYTSPRRQVALHTYLLYCLVTYTHHQNDTCVTLFAVAAVMLKPFTQRLASLGMLLVRLEIIATTYRSTIFKTYAFSLYSHLCIYVSIQLPIYTRYIWTGSTRWLWAIRGAPEDDDQVNVRLRYPSISVDPPSLNHDVLIGCDWASWELHLEAEIEWTQRCTWRPGSSELRDALRGRDRANLEGVIEWVGDTLGGCD